MSDEDGRQFGQAGRIRLQRFVGGFGGIRARARIDANQFPMVVGHHEIVFREFKTGEHVDAAGKDLGYAPGRKSVAGCSVLRKRSEERRVGKECRYRWGADQSKKSDRETNEGSRYAR